MKTTWIVAIVIAVGAGIWGLHASGIAFAGCCSGTSGGGMAGMNHDATPVATSAPASQPTTQKATYVCPMHSDVTSDKPGKCSKCGMDLVKK